MALLSITKLDQRSIDLGDHTHLQARPPRPVRCALSCLFNGGRLARILINVYHTQMTSVDLIREMRQAGWVLDRVNGSHHVFKHPQRPGIVVVPHPKKDLGQGLVKAIRRDAGILPSSER